MSDSGASSTSASALPFAQDIGEGQGIALVVSTPLAGAGVSVVAESQKPRRRSLIPMADTDLRALALQAGQAWAASALQLRFTSSAAFYESAAAFSEQVDSIDTLSASRRPLTLTLQALDREINSRVANLKHYIADRYGKERARDFYEEFGIQRIGKSYQLPIDRAERDRAMGQLCESLHRHQLDDHRYGLAWWTDICDRYQATRKQASHTDEALSQHVREKNARKLMLRQTLQSLVLLVQANYPDSWREELLRWGFQAGAAAEPAV
jgi:hypothetical protein